MYMYIEETKQDLIWEDTCIARDGVSARGFLGQVSGSDMPIWGYYLSSTCL